MRLKFYRDTNRNPVNGLNSLDLKIRGDKSDNRTNP